MMRDFVVGETNEEKFASINQTLKHFRRRLQRTILGVAPPVPFSNYVENVSEDGVLLRCMFLSDGKVVKGHMHIEEITGEDAIDFRVEVFSASGMASHSFSARKTSLPVEPNLRVSAGDRLVLRTLQPLRVRKIWVGLLLEIDISTVTRRPLLIEQFDKLVEEDDKNDY